MRPGGRRQAARAVALSVVLAAGCVEAPGGPAVILHPEGREPVRVAVEIADTPPARERGLMFRKELAPDAGMLFVFEEEREHAFWMKNTPLPLDIVFISGDGRIAGIARNTTPYSLRMIRVGAPSRLVLEVNAGFAERHGLSAGDRVTWSGIESEMLPR